MTTKILWRRLVAAAGCAAALALNAPAADALKYAPVEHHLKADPALPQWQPAHVDSVPEEEVSLVGADVMDEITLGWIKLYRKAYPLLSVTMEAKASGAGAPGSSPAKPTWRPSAASCCPRNIRRSSTSSATSPPRSASRPAVSVRSARPRPSIALVDKDNPIPGLSLAKLDAIHSTTRKRGHADISTWGDLGLTGAWKDCPIHLDGLKSPNGIEQFVKMSVMEGGDYKPNIQFTKGVGFTHAFTVAAQDMATHPGGLTYALFANVTPNVRVVPLCGQRRRPVRDADH